MEIKKLKYFAGGQWITSKTDKYMDIYNPSTGEVQAQTPCCTEEEVNYAVECAKKAYPAWSDTPVFKRVQIKNPLSLPAELPHSLWARACVTLPPAMTPLFTGSLSAFSRALSRSTSPV